MDRNNYLLVNEFLEYLLNVEHLKPVSVDRYKSYLKHALYWADNTPFSRADEKQPGLIEFLENQYSQKTGDPLSRESWRKILGIAVRFFNWARWAKPKQFSTISERWLRSLVIPPTVRKQSARDYVSFETILAIQKYGKSRRASIVDFRDVSAALFLYMSGLRASAFVSLPIGCVNISRREVRQDPAHGVRTKNDVMNTTFLLPIDEVLNDLIAWDSFIRGQLPPKAYWFTPLRNQWGEITLTTNSPGVNRNQLLNRRLRRLFKNIGLPYQSAHKFRHGHATWSLEHCNTTSEFKAISQNLSHSDTRVTDAIYAIHGLEERRQIILNLGTNKHVLDRSESPIINRASQPVGTSDIEVGDPRIMSHHFE